MAAVALYAVTWSISGGIVLRMIGCEESTTLRSTQSTAAPLPENPPTPRRTSHSPQCPFTAMTRRKRREGGRRKLLSFRKWDLNHVESLSFSGITSFVNIFMQTKRGRGFTFSDSSYMMSPKNQTNKQSSKMNTDQWLKGQRQFSLWFQLWYFCHGSINLYHECRGWFS